MTAMHNKPGIRAHRAKYGLDRAMAKRAVTALAALEELRDPLRVALAEIGRPAADIYVKAALQRLVRGPNGENFL
jgi:hypothetical protein